MLEECFLLFTPSTGVSCVVSSRFAVSSFVSLNLELPHGINSLEMSLAERDNICTMLVFELRNLAEVRIKAFYDAVSFI